MDNMGTGGGFSMENKGVFSAPESANPMGEVADFNEFLKQNEQFRPKMEMPGELAQDQEPNPGEMSSEAKSNGMPAMAAPQMVDNDDPEAVAKAELNPIPIKPNFETLPKAYVAAVNKLLARDRKDPHRMLADVDVARWDLMEKAYGRKRGDGLNGRLPE